jgi:hypothetical protein
MKSRMFRSIMNASSAIMFIAFFSALLLSFVAAFYGYRFSVTQPDLMGSAPYPKIMIAGMIAKSFAGAFEFSASMLLGAALLFRADRWLEKAE